MSFERENKIMMFIYKNKDTTSVRSFQLVELKVNQQQRHLFNEQDDAALCIIDKSRKLIKSIL